MTDYTKLQNGSDIRGIALEGVAGESINLTPAIATDIGAAFARWLVTQTGKSAGELRVALGRDSRLSGESLMTAIAGGIASLGVTWESCGMASTPAMYMATVLPGLGYDAGIMITASHLPYNRNGIKFFVPSGGLDKADITAILGDCRPTAAEQVTLTVLSGLSPLMTAYCDHLRQVIIDGINSTASRNKPLAGMKIAVDAGNGAGGFFATEVLAPLGADVSASVFLEPDGHFPNHIPNPENAAAMAAISRATVEGSCDLGLIFDTDVDRASAVDSSGRELSRNKLIALMSAIVAEQAPHSTIVTDSVTSSQLRSFIEDELGCHHHRFKRGYKNVINEAVRLGAEGVETLLAIETSGHGALKENYFLDDGAYLCAKIVIKTVRLREQGSSLGELLAKLGEPLEARELRARIDCEDFASYGRQVLAELEEYAATRTDWQVADDNHEGIRVSVPAAAGWFLLRLSLHDPQMPLNIESDKAGGVEEICRELMQVLAQHNKLVW